MRGFFVKLTTFWILSFSSIFHIVEWKISDFEKKLNGRPTYRIHKFNYSSFLFSFSKWADDPNILEIIPLFIVLFWMIIFIFLLCEPGVRMTMQFEVFSDKLSRCKWYLLSIEMRQMYLIFLSNTQNSIKMFSYANIICERETSKKVGHCGVWYSYTYIS